MDAGAGMSRRTKILIALAVGLGILLIGVAVSVRRGDATRDGIAADLESDPTSRQWVAALRTYYPREYSDLVDRVSAASLAGADARNRAEQSFIDDFLARKIDAIAAAPDAQLLEIASAKAETLRRDHECNPTAVIDADTWTAPEIARSRVTALEIAAAHAGETSGRRPRRRPGPADYEALYARMEARDPELMRAMPNGASSSETPERQCRYDLLMDQAMTELPPAVGAVIVVAVLRPPEASR
ncbi:MAG: hypothetical protein QOD42_244 [Sphingomonadales bacterium]|jgi:hypothetical protein|nr:hypothetical protein [Sphingomonadales bacterium]